MSMETPESTTENTARSPEADLALIRSMMQAGRQRMGIDGIHLVIWGLLLSLAFLAQYLSAVSIIPQTLFGIWIPTYALGLTASYMAQRRAPRLDTENNLALKIYSNAWNATGFPIAFYFFPSVLTGNFNHMVITNLTLALVGSAFFVTSLITGLNKLRYVAFGWWALLVFFAIAGDIGPKLLLILSAAAFLLILAPGLLLRRMLGEEA